MNPKVMLIAFIGVGLLGILVFIHSIKPAALPPYPAFVNVYVTKRDLKVGEWVDSRTDLVWKRIKWEKHSQNNVLTSQNVDGDVLRSSIPAGSFLFKRDLVAPGDADFLAYALPPGKTAMSLAVKIQNAVDRFIQPGEHVDVVMRNTNAQVARVLLTNIRILAVDHRLGAEVKVVPKGPSAPGSSPQQARPQPVVTATQNPDTPVLVTLEVTPEDAIKLSQGMNKGVISLILRSVLANTDSEKKSQAFGFLGPVFVYNGNVKTKEENY